MENIYEMKDLGYKRTPTAAIYRVEMGDGSKWDVPVQAIADSRDENYKEDDEDTIGSIRSGGLPPYEINDWAGNNMNWSDVEQFAVPVPASELKKPGYQEGWTNGEKEIVGAL